MSSSDRRPSGGEGDYQATTDSIAHSAEKVEELEAEKAKLSPSDPRARELTHALESEVEKMERDGDAQRALVEEASSDEPSRQN